jgi:Transposase DDE domain
MKGMKKYISMPCLLKIVRSQFEKIPDTARRDSMQSLSDCLMSGLAVFSLKMPSLLQFDKLSQTENVKDNLQNLYGINKVPCDTYLRERLDEIDIEGVKKPFRKIFALLQRQKILERYSYYNGYYLISLDGTGCFSSSKIHCESCCIKKHRNGNLSYYHQMLGAVLVHPDERTVIPLAPEAILKQDGEQKNDCERNAAKRLLTSMRREHPHLKMLIVEDSLYANAPHLHVLKELKMSYIIGVKPNDHQYLFDFLKGKKLRLKEEVSPDGTSHRYRFYNNAPLNETNHDVKVNFLDYEEISPKGKVQHFTWITDIELDSSTLRTVMKGGRARWKIENETFNTLKTQGYHFEHNFGHGYKNLSTIMSMLMFLAFLIDQTLETDCALFQKALRKVKTKIVFWADIRSLFRWFFISSWQDFYEAIATQNCVGTIGADTS